MIKETITYTNFDGELVTEELNFHLSKLELTELATELPDGVADDLSTNSSPQEIVAIVVEKLGQKGIIEFIKKLILKSYGIRKTGQDGKTRFLKTAEITEDFASSVAFQDFVMKLVEDDDAANKFFNGVIPSELAAQIPEGFNEIQSNK